MKKMIKFFTLQLFVTLVYGWFETCDYIKAVSTTSNLVLVSPNYPQRYEQGSSCKWFLTAPVGYTIQLTCTYDLISTGSDCSSQRLYVSRDGDKELNYSEFYCGYSTFTRTSVGNEITLGYTSNIGGDGWFYCEAKTVKTTQDNCQCGWSKSVSALDTLLEF